MKLELIRDSIPDSPHNFGKLYIDGILFGETLEDQVRLDDEPKVQGETAIPTGIYQVIVSRSHRFNRRMPEILAVPGFSGIRIHGGNTEADTSGCPLLGLSRTETTVRNCGDVNARLLALLETEGIEGRPVYIEVS